MKTTSPLLYETLQSNEFNTRKALDINEEAYTSLINYLSREESSRTAQPNLIVGESGSGKTFLMKRLYHNVNKYLSDKLQPVIIEGKTIFCTDNIWLQCILKLKIKQNGSFFDEILKWQEDNSKRIVLIIDDIQYYFRRTDNTDQYVLRGKLNRAGSPILIATADEMLPAVTEYDAAFFDGFKTTYLKPLDIFTIERMTDGEYDPVRLNKIMSYMPKTIRSLSIAIEIMNKSDESKEDLAFLSDFYYSRYQEKYDKASKQVQRILSALSQSDSGLSLSEIRNMTGQENGKISPYLTLMTAQKTILKETKGLRGGIYSIHDPLFKLWLRQNTTNNNI